MSEKTNELIKLLKMSDLSQYTFCIDFDGTCVTHDFPEVGSTVPYAVEVLQALEIAGAKLIIWTIRCDNPKSKNGDCENPFYLQAAKDWFSENNIPIHAANINPTQSEWSSSPKAYCNFYIDDAAIGTPLVYGKHRRAYVDWYELLPMLVSRFALNA